MLLKTKDVFGMYGEGGCVGYIVTCYGVLCYC